MLYPFKFNPYYVEKVWGGNRLHHRLHKSVDAQLPCGESWEVFAVEDRISEVSNGFLAENNIEELIEVYMGDLVGDKVFNEHGLQFPLLCKYIDATSALSVQVHPDDALAMQRYGTHGKTELWYVVEADAGAGLYVGFKKGVAQADYHAALKSGTVDSLLQFYPVQKGDCFYIPAGTVHAIGKGVLLAEIQQSSDCTYRIFDWNRTDAYGISRPLHLQEAEDAIHFNDNATYKIDYQQVDNKTIHLLNSKFFNVNLLNFTRPVEKVYAKIDSFVIYMCVAGGFSIVYEQEETKVAEGETVLVPALATELFLLPQDRAEILEIHL